LGDDVPLGALAVLLALLLILSAFFSGTETALMSLNRYKLRHKARAGHRGARLAESLLERPDRLIGLILLGNNAVNIIAASLVGVISLQLGGQTGFAIGTAIMTLVVLIFAETAPKTLAALHPEKVAFPAAYIYVVLLKILYPFVWFTNLLANGVLYLLGLRKSDADGDALSREELRTIVHEAGTHISTRYRRMLVSILDLERVTVDDVMVPHNEIIGIDLADELDEITQLIKSSEHTRLPVFRDAIDNVVGLLHLRNLANVTSTEDVTKENIEELVSEAYFVPEGTPLSTQLVQFQKSRQRLALVVDEYGDIQGMVTLEDILEEIVGEFTTDPADNDDEIVKEKDDRYLVDGSANVRDINRLMNWKLPTDGPKTLNGLVLEFLETIPEPGTRLKIEGYPMEIVESDENKIKVARIFSRKGEATISVG
jgi:Mg2+/Co2+ transporter CorB